MKFRHRLTAADMRDDAELEKYKYKGVLWLQLPWRSAFIQFHSGLFSPTYPDLSRNISIVIYLA